MDDIDPNLHLIVCNAVQIFYYFGQKCLLAVPTVKSAGKTKIGASSVRECIIMY